MTGTLMYNNLYIYLFIGLFLLCCGILGLLYRRTLIGMLISMELIMNGAGLNFVAFNRFTSPDNAYGMSFTLFIMGKMEQWTLRFHEQHHDSKYGCRNS